MTFAGDVRKVALAIAALVEREGFAYAFMGGLAVPIWGIPRATYDVDLTLAADTETVNRFLRSVKDAGFEVEPPFERGFRDSVSGMQKLRIDWWTAESRRIEVDVFLVTTEYQSAAFARRVRVRLNGSDLWVLGPADLILHKLVAGRPKDLADVQNILSVQGMTDAEYTRHWARRLGVAAALDEALQRAGLS